LLETFLKKKKKRENGAMARGNSKGGEGLTRRTEKKLM